MMVCLGSSGCVRIGVVAVCASLYGPFTYACVIILCHDTRKKCQRKGYR